MRITILLPVLFLCIATGCASEPQQSAPTTEANGTPAATKPEKQGTSVKVGADGIEVQSDDRSIKVNSDSLRIDLPK